MIRKVDLTGDYETTIYDVARRLLAAGADPCDRVETRRHGILSMSGIIGELAKLQVVFAASGPQLRPWKPFPTSTLRPLAAKTAAQGRPGGGARMRNLVHMRDALRRSEYFGDVLAGPSWANWRVLLIAIAGEALDDAEAVAFKALSGRTGAPTEAAREFWAVVGRRGGKSRSMAVLAAWLAGCKDYRGILAPGERGQLQVLSATRDQAGNLFNFIVGIFEESRALRGLVESKTADTLCLKCHIDIVVRPASFRSTRGSTCVGVLCDEISFWRSEDSSNPDTEILRALRPSLMTTNGPLVAISSPYSRHGELWKAYRKHFGKDGSRVLVVKAASDIMNPGLDRAFIDAQYEDDPISAAAEYGAEFRSDVAEFVSMEVLEACTADGVFELPPISGASYIAFVDPSGGSSDSMTLAIAHRDKFGYGILDCIRECRPPFSPESVVDEFCNTIKQYHISKVCGDRYAGEWPRERFRMCGIAYELSERPKSDIYRDMLPLLNSRKVQLLDDRRLISQLHGLERRTARGGKDSIDHAPGAKDDLANAAAGALVLVSGKVPMIITDAILNWSRQPVLAAQRTLHTVEGRFNFNG